MSMELAKAGGAETNAVTESDAWENWRFVTFKIESELLGVRVDEVQEVLTSRQVAAIPLVPSEIAGFINLRGQIVTAIDLRSRLGLSKREEGASWMNVVVKDGDELFSLVVDEVGDVIDVRKDLLSMPPATLGSVWRNYCEGVFQLEKGLLVAVDVKKILDIEVVEY